MAEIADCDRFVFSHIDRKTHLMRLEVLLTHVANHMAKPPKNANAERSEVISTHTPS
jgi:hypothetical protein